jgi:hypothetical protein
VLLDSNQLVGLFGSIERCFELGGREITTVAVEAACVVPVDPAERGDFDVVDGAPRALRRPANEFGSVVPVDRLGQGVS